MERFVYVCNENEFVKFLEAFGKNLKTKDEIFYNDKVFALQDITNIKQQTVDNLRQTVNELKTKLENKFNLGSKDIIYISVHPGGTDKDVIKNLLTAVNSQLKKDSNKYKTLVTYHGSQNLKANDSWKEEKLDIGKLNNAIKDFIKPDIIGIIKKHKTKFLIEKELFNKIFSAPGDNISKAKLKEIFEISGNKDINNIKSELTKYIKALDEVNIAYNDFYQTMGKIKKSEEKKDE